MKDTLVIDIGSNTIKCLLGHRDSDGKVCKLFEQTLDSRISSTSAEGLAGNAAEIISDSIEIFRKKAAEFCPDFKLAAVATSALRESPERDAILERVRALCGAEIRVLSGDEEAKLSFAGAMTDPSVDSYEPTAYFDLGGGSLEIVFGKKGKAKSFTSLPIGAVNMTRKFVVSPKSAVSASEIEKMLMFARGKIGEVFAKKRPAFSTLVGAGGAVVAARTAKKILFPQGCENVITLPQMRTILMKVCAVTADGRAEKFGVSAGRCDIVPAAFACICALMERLGAMELVHTFCNLRYGVLLSKIAKK